MNFRRRRIRNLTLVAMVAVLLVVAVDILELSLQVQQYSTGWLLIGIMGALLAYYLRKRLTVIPLGSASSWAQWHYYLGLFLLIAFLVHIEFAWPDGLVEVALAVAFAVVICTGMGGVLINRLFARRLAILGEEVLYERIPAHRQALQQQAEAVVMAAVEQSDSTTLAAYYQQHLASYFSKPRFLLAHIFGSSYGHERLQQGLQKQLRYLSQREAEYAVQLEALLRRKNCMDTHQALQGALKYWGVAHAPIALILLLLTGLHVVLVYAFRGAA